MSENTYQGYALNMALNSGACTATGAATTLTVVTAVDTIIKGEFGTQVATGAKTLAFVTTQNVAATSTVGYQTANAPILYGGASTNVNAPGDNKGQAMLLVHCADAAGVVKSFAGPVVQLDDGGNLRRAAQFPKIPNQLVPFCYQLLKASATAGDIIVGTSNWNSTGFTNTLKDIAFLPQKPVTS